MLVVLMGIAVSLSPAAVSEGRVFIGRDWLGWRKIAGLFCDVRLSALISIVHCCWILGILSGNLPC